MASADQSIDAIVQYSRDQVSSDNPAALECSSEMACLHQTDIPVAFVRADHDNATDEVLATLEKYDLTTRRPGGVYSPVHHKYFQM